MWEGVAKLVKQISAELLALHTWTADPPSQLHPQRKRGVAHILKVIPHLSPEISITVQTHTNKHLKTTTERSCADRTLYLFLFKKKKKKKGIVLADRFNSSYIWIQDSNRVIL